MLCRKSLWGLECFWMTHSNTDWRHAVSTTWALSPEQAVRWSCWCNVATWSVVWELVCAWGCAVPCRHSLDDGAERIQLKVRPRLQPLVMISAAIKEGGKQGRWGALFYPCSVWVGGLMSTERDWDWHWRRLILDSYCNKCIQWRHKGCQWGGRFLKLGVTKTCLSYEGKVWEGSEKLMWRIRTIGLDSQYVDLTPKLLCNLLCCHSLCSLSVVECRGYSHAWKKWHFQEYWE